MKRLILFFASIIFITGMTVTSNAQLSITNNTTRTIDFSTNVPGVNNNVYLGSGFQSVPNSGQLSSGGWQVTGWSDGDLAFGNPRTTGDYARGLATGAVTTGGFYAYRGAPGSAANPSLLIQPGGSDFAPGTLTLRIQNNGATMLDSLAFSYNIFVRNDQSRSSSFNFSYSLDNSSYSPVPGLDYTTPEAIDALGYVQVGSSPSRSATINALNLAPGAYVYFRWSSADVGGTGSRDEIALDDITVTGTYAAPPAGTLQFGAASFNVTEGVPTASVTVTRTGGSNGANSATYSFGNTGAVGGAACAAGIDYINTGGTVTFADGDAADKTISIPICDDAAFENSEAFQVFLSGANIGTPQQAGVAIADNDAAPTFSIDDVTMSEGNAGTTNYVFTVTKSGSTELTSSVLFATADGTATLSGNDYQSNSDTLVFAANDTTQQLSVNVAGDLNVEPNETFFVNLSGATNATISDSQGVGTINNDDADPAVVAVEFSSYFEDETQTLTVGVTRTGDTSGTTTVDYSTQPLANNLGDLAPANGGTSCTMGVDYITTSGTLTFAPKQQSQTFDIQLCGDSLDEYTESFRVVLSNPTNAALGNPSEAFVHINDTANQYVNPNMISFSSEAFPYPAPLTVAGAPTTISGVRVTLYDFFDFNPDDIDVLLVGPQGQKMLLMADAGGSGASRGTLTFQDNGGEVLPDSSTIFSGKFEPTSWEPGQTSFPAPAPAAPYNEPGSTVGGEVTLASVFGGTNPNGTWNLYVRIDNGAFQQLGLRGAIFGGWGLQFIAPTAANVSVSGQLRSGKTPVSNTTVMITGGNLTQPLFTKSNSFGNYSFDGLAVGQAYVVTVVSNRYNFPQSSIVLNLADNVANADFEAEER
jgi:hypothetical protein